jgi:RNA polymerase sigma-70 factor (ECF subfamily)
MLQALKKPRRIRHESDLPYLRTVMRNAFYARKHLPASSLSIEELPSDSLGCARSDTAGSVQARMTIRAIADLPAHQRDVVVAVDLEGFSYREAAGMFGVPEGTVMSRLHRARKSLVS